MQVELEEILCPRCCAVMINYGEWCDCPECGFIDGDLPQDVIKMHKYIFDGVDSREEIGKKC
jgi:hypothetical protein